jgi:hypothetical protein
LWLKASPRST